MHHDGDWAEAGQGGASARGCGIVPGRQPATASRRATGQHCSPVRPSPASCVFLHIGLPAARRRVRIVARGWRIRPEASRQPDTARHTLSKTSNSVGDAGEHRRAPRPDLSKGHLGCVSRGVGALGRPSPALRCGSWGGGSVYRELDACRGCRAPTSRRERPALALSLFFFLLSSSLFVSVSWPCGSTLAFGSPWSVNASRADATSLRHLDGCVVGRAPCSSQNVRVAMRRYSRGLRGLRWLRHWMISSRCDWKSHSCSLPPQPMMPDRGRV